MAGKVATKKVSNKALEDCRAILVEMLKKMSVKAEVEATEDVENQAIVYNIKADEETGLLIGNRGETLFALQYILGIIYRQKTGDWQRIIVNVGDYREKQEEYLKHLALQALERLRETGQEQRLYNLTPGQRRVVHLTLSQEAGIVSQSEGEGNERYLIIKNA